MIDVKDLEYIYAGTAKTALNRINFNIDCGEVFGFLGPSGSGKSTTQKILFRLLSGYNGSAKIDGVEVNQWGKKLYEKIGVGFELPNHYLKLTALENLNFFKAFYSRSKSPMDLLAMVGLEKDANKKVGDYSKGMKMRLNFVRAIMHDPEILFLDEPTSGLDPVNSRIVKDLILEQKKQGKTIFITTHQMHDADELCDRVAFIADGSIMALDKPQNLKLKGSKRMVEVRLKNDHNLYEFSLDELGKNRVFSALIERSEIETIHSKEATLDDIFIQITGKTLS
ncbi:MAG: ABC transporter ATP-binding protein [Crocinitomicaceae bacterium]|nr:ABC transporter ATP-binding protein [Crocinitomicaceae bacterium]MBK9592947.1 ABC transporter ATP-binding protein [Crocinitomicaceae bacterium]